MAEHALTELARFLPMPGEGRTAVETLPGGNFGAGGVEEFERTLVRDFDWLPGPQLRRYVRTYGTRVRVLLDNARAIDDLGIGFGADLYQAEVDFLMNTEWAMSADDIIWRRTKLGLRLVATEIDRLAEYLDSPQGANARSASPG